MRERELGREKKRYWVNKEKEEREMAVERRWEVEAWRRKEKKRKEKKRKGESRFSKYNSV